MRPEYRRLLPAAVIALSLIPFLPGLHGPFLLDDQSNLLSARAPSGTWSEFVDAIFRNTSGLFRRPLSNLSFIANYHLLGQEPFGYKLVNLVVHFLVALSLFGLSGKVLSLLYPQLPARERAICGLLAAVLWTVHPLQVSTVLYIVQRMAQLSTLFLVLAVLYSLRFLEKTDADTSPVKAVAAAAGAFGLALLALLSKENGVLFPALLMAVWLSLPQVSRSRFTSSPGRRLFFALTAWLPLAIGGLVAIVMHDWVLGGFSHREFTVVERALTQPYVLGHYVQTILVPDFRTMGLYLDFFPTRDSSDHMAWLALAATLALPVLAILCRQRAPVLSFAVLWFFASHALESTIFPLEMAFEHRNYLALFGPALATAYYFSRLAQAVPGLHSLRLLVLIPLLVLAANTTLRAQQWSTPAKFVLGEANHHPDSARAQNAAASFDAERGDVESATRRVARVQALRPDNYWPWTLDLYLACGVPGHKVEWQKMLAILDKRPREVTSTDMLRSVSMLVQDGKCPYLSLVELDNHAAQLARIFARENMPHQAERALLVRSYLARSTGDEQRYRALLDQAAHSNPAGSQALSDLAYHELNRGNLAAAASAIAQLKRRIGEGRDRHKVAELEAFLQQARAEQAARQ